MDTIVLTGADQQVGTSSAQGPPKSYYGFSLRETSGTTGAIVEIYDGTSTAGELIESISLAPGESARESYAMPGGVGLATGLFVDIVSGSVRGVVRYG